MGRAVFVAGLLCRRWLRRELLAAGLEFKEDKGLLDSLFIVSGPESVLRTIKRNVDWIGRD